MNRNRYRLVFNTTLRMQVPVAEMARSRGKGASGLSRALAGAVFAGVILALPVCAADLPGNALPDGAVVKYGDIGIAQSGNTLNINQATQNGIIHWNSFNIGSQATVNFNQPAVTAATLNRVTGNEASIIQGALNAPGAVYVINRNGILFDKGAQVNLHTLVASTLDIRDDDLFKNGFLSLDGREAAFSDQYNSTGELDLGRLAGTVKVADGAYVASRQDGRIILMAPDVTNEGRTETQGGQIILAAGKKAYFHTPDSTDSLLRGLVVVVEGGGTARNLGTIAAGAGGDVTLIGAIVKQEGAATASTTVNVNGTIHLLAQQINPDKTAATVNNRPAANETGESVFGTGSHTAIMPALDEGKVSAAIAAGKFTRQQIEDYYSGKADPAAFYALMSDETIQDAQSFSRSRIFAQGKSVWVQENASLVAPSGEITLFARNGSDNPNPYLIDQSSSQSFLKQYNGAEGLCLDCRLQVDEGARLDVGGLRDVSIDMERNVVEVELRGNELRDTPLLHGEENAYYEAMYGDPDNPLYGKKIKVDIRDTITVDVNGQTVTRQGTALADASGYIAQIGRRIDEKSTTGGTVNLYSEGGVVVRRDAKIDFSGGSLQYRNGEVTTSQLVYKGRLYDIATAAPDRLYQGLGPDRTVYEQGYVEGKDAGTLRIVSPVAALQGTMDGTTVAGIHQRGGTGDPLPRGGQLILGFDQTVDAGTDQDYRLMSKVSFGRLKEDAPDYATSLWVELSDEQKAALGREIDLNQAMREIVLDPIQLREGGISRLSVYSNNAIELASGQTLDLGPGGSVSLTGAQVDIDGRIDAAGGEVSLKSEYGVYNSASALVGMPMQAYDQHVSINGTISTAGLWSNDYLDRLLRLNYQPVVLSGGSISVNAGGGSLSLGQGSLLDASAGAWLKSDGKTMAGGRGGNISLKQGVGNDANNQPSMNLAGRIQSYGVLDSSGKVGRGGKLTVQTAENVRIGGAQPAAPGELRLDEDFFVQGGFAGYTVKSSAGNLSIAGNTRLAPRALTRVVSSAGITQRSAADMAGFSQASLLERDRVAKAERPATDLALSAANNLSMGQQASIALDSQAALQLSADSNIDINGDLSAPGGSMTLKAGEAGGFYAPNVSIWLGSDARLSVAGITRTYQANGLIQGSVLDGGSISLLTGGYLMVEAGALLDASGSVGTIDLPMEANGSVVYARTALPSAGGTIRLAAAEGLFVQEGAVLQAKGGSSKAEAGTLRVELDRPLLSDEGTIASYPADPVSGDLYAHRLLVSDDASAAVPAYLGAPGTSLQGADNASGVLSVSHLKDFDNLDIKAGNRITFDSTMSIAARGRLTFDSPNFVLNDAAAVSLSGMYVNLGNGDPVAQDRAEAATGGNGVLEVNAGLIDLTGNFALQGVKETRLNSSGDIRLVGVVDTNADKTLIPRGQFSTAGDMAFKSAQVYASTLSEYVLKSVKPDGLIGFAGWTYDNGDSYIPPLPLAGGSSLSVQADLIEQAGVLRAPIGHIALEASKTLTLADGSLTSVSAEGQAIPFGRIQNGRSWVYDFTTPQGTVVSRTIYSGDEGIVDLPAKAIELKGDSVDVKATANVNVSGGGDLVGHEFAPGPGGSSDYLAAPGVFAIMPASNPAFAPSDFQANHYSYVSASSGLVQSGARQSVQPGDSIYLSAIPELGIAAGYYTLLPGHYALLPGAYAVRAVANTTDMVARDNVRRQDGSYLASGYTTSLGDTDTGVHRWSGFEIAGRDVVATNKDFSFNIPAEQLKAQTLTGRSEIVDYRASQLLPASNQTYELALPKLAQDAGRLSIEARSDLNLNGQIDFSKPEGGLGGELDIASRKIAVTDGSAPYVADAGEYLVLDVDLLASYDVDSLMIGGTRKAIADDASRVKVNQVAEAVLVETTADKPLVAAEVMLVSRGSITLAEGSEVRGEGEGGLKNETLVFGDEAAGESGDGVLLRASSGALRGVERRNVSLAGQADDGLYTASDALVHGEKSVNLDATYTAFNLGRVNLGANGALQLGATRIAMGQVSQVLEGVFVTNEFLDNLGNPEELVLKSYSNFDIHGDANLGSADTRSLILQGAGFAGMTTGNFSVTAQNVVLANPDDRPFAAPGAGGSGTMTVYADNIGFGSGLVETTGFDTVDLAARGEIAGLEGSGGLQASGDLNMTAQRIAGYQGSDMNFAAGGKLVTANYAAADGETLPVPGRTPMGARMAFSAGRGIDHGGHIDMPAGWLSMTAGSGNVNLLAGSRIFTGGVVRQFHGADDYVNVYVAGGQTVLDARAGDVNVDSGATVDVSGRDVLTSGQSADPINDGKGSADAGSLLIYADGAFRLNGELKGGIVLPDAGRSSLTEDEASRRPSGGALVVDAASLTGGLSNLLDRASGFGSEFSLRQRSGDLTVAADDTLTARYVNLSADNGVLDIAGKIDARSPEGGWVMAAAGKELYLRDGARIDARATDARQRGGEVYLLSGMNASHVDSDASAGAMVLEKGSSVDVGGTLAHDDRTTQRSGGRVHLQAPRLASGQDVRITQSYGSYNDNGGQGAIGTAIGGAAEIEAIGNRVFEFATVGSSQMSALKNDSQNYINSAAAARARLGGSNPDSALQVRPGEEVRSSGDLIFSSDHDFDTTTNGVDVPGMLTLRAAGNLLINGNLSDGFDKAAVSAFSGYKLDSGDSWSYRLVAGSDLTAADPMAVRRNADPATGDFVLKGGKLIRTGTGAIQIAAAGDIEVGLNYSGSYGAFSREGASYNTASVIYTAGRADSTGGFDAPNDNLFKAAYPVDGGSLSFAAGGSIRAPEVGELMNQWLVRRGYETGGSITTALTWGIDYRYFDQGVGALGGGNVRVRAGADIENLSVSLPTTGRDYATGAIGTDILETGGGNLSVAVQGDIRSAVFYVQRGEGRVVSGNSIGAMSEDDDKNLLLALGDSRFQVHARTDLALESAFNPTVVPLGTKVSSLLGTPKKSSYFFSYGEDSGVSLVSAQGDIVLNNKMTLDDFYSDVLSGVSATYGQQDGRMYLVYPGSLNASSVNGDVKVARSFWLYPSSGGELHLLAGGDVTFGEGEEFANVVMSDQSASARSSLTNPVATYAIGPDDGTVKSSSVPVHADDPDPVRIYAENGDIKAVSGGTGLVLPKSVELLAGRDIVNTSVIAQNLNADQTSIIRAGRDVRYTSPRNNSGLLVSNGEGIRIGGGGYLEVAAGRNIDLGTTGGIVSSGNLDNPNLAYGGADIVLLAGMGTWIDPDGRTRVRLPDYDTFLSEYGDETKTGFYAGLLDYERLRQALIDEDNAALSYKQVLDRLEEPGYRQAMTQKAMPDYEQAVAAFERMLASDVASRREQAARRLYYSALQQASSEVSLMKQLVSLGFDLGDLNRADQPGMIDIFGATLANSGLAVSTLEAFTRLFEHAAALISANRPNDPSYDVLGSLGYQGRADRAIEALLPAGDYAGDYNGFYSQVRTEQGSDIDILVPGGSNTIGLVNTEKVDLSVDSSGREISRADSTFGLYTTNGGSIRSYSQGDFLVNTSRVFTLGWEATLDRTPGQYLLRDDIFLYSAEGDVDAGKGAKTASSAPPPTFVTDDKGFTKSDIGKSISGSGIGVLLVRDVINRGDTYLIAPNGEVNAGDAGIRASGNIFIDANRVIGADNIVAVGVAIGVPAAVDTSGLSVSGIGNLGDAAQAANQATSSLASGSEEAQKASAAMKQALADFKPSSVSVEVLGFGEGSTTRVCENGSAECNRQ